MTEHAPTLQDDEAKLVEYAVALADAVELVADSWLHKLVTARLAGQELDEHARGLLDAGAATAVAELRELLLHDIAHQPVGPLEILRNAVRFPTQVLSDAAVPAPVRDEFAIRNFPDDAYDLTPASFADVDPSLHECGLMWGAAKAHVHLRRRREAQAP